MKKGLYIVAIATSLLGSAGCSQWPENGTGGAAEHSSLQPYCDTAERSKQTLSRQLGCANLRRLTLERLGAERYQPALLQLSRLQAQRVWRQLNGGLEQDARADLEIYDARLDRLEMQLSALLDRLSGDSAQGELAGVGAAAELDSLQQQLNCSAVFPRDSHRINIAFSQQLQKGAALLRRYPDIRIQVIGHADDTGSSEYNQKLSIRRAAAVREVLVSLGISDGRISVEGRGETQPLSEQQSVEARLASRRTEIRLQNATAGNRDEKTISLR